MPTRPMDQGGFQRISRARGPNDDFARRAGISARNNSQAQSQTQQSTSETTNTEEKKEADDNKDKSTKD
ncbi:hypothetical protein F4777DRAFT_573678 [Nemania sp. FL0916]|nr:hypothetical protein F4777DRAFT_573678 [Nemania sp. FL0916]